MNRKIAFEDIPTELIRIHEKIDRLLTQRAVGEKSLAEPVEFLSVKLVAKNVGVSDSTVRRWIKQGRLPHSQPGRRIIVRRQDLEDFVADSLRKKSGDYRSEVDDFYSL